MGPASAKVGRAYDGLLALFGSELKVLRSVAVGDLEAAGHPVLARAIGRMRQGQAEVLAGYDGVYGTITLTGQEPGQGD